jgi:hypothetical protein
MDIPQDIIDNVIAAVGDDTRVLKQCTLVSSSFLLPSRKQLFSRITLSKSETCQGIYQFLVQYPVIQSFVRTITFITGSSWKSFEFLKDTSLLAILRLPFCCLEGFSITVDRHYGTWNWIWFSTKLQDALLNIINSPTLKTLYLTGVTKVPTTFFLHIVNLTTLELSSISPLDFYDENSSSPTRAASMGVAPMASHAVIDRCVWRIEQDHPRYEIPLTCLFLTNSGQRLRTTGSRFLPFMCRLRFFEIYIGVNSYNFGLLSIMMHSLCISLTSPATLEHLKFNLCFRGDEYDGLCNADAWRQLDSITTYPTGSRLQRIEINVNYYFPEIDWEESFEDKVEKAVYDSLPLLCTKGILFVEVVLGDF